MALFLSTYTNRLDKKGRVSVPSGFRSSLTDSDAGNVITFRSLKMPAIDCCTRSRMLDLSQEFERKEIYSGYHDELAFTIFAEAHNLSIDNDGRIILPENLIIHAGLNDNVVFVGRGPTFQIWNPDTFAKYQKEARQRLFDSPNGLMPPATMDIPR